MAYGEARVQVTSDTFDSSIDSNWTNGPGDYETLSWASGGYIQPSATFGEPAIKRNTGTYDNSQYCTVTAQTMTASVSEIWAMCRMQSSDTDESAYSATNTESGNQFKIYVVNSSLGITTLAETNTGAALLGTGDTMTCECEGATIRMGDDIGGGDSQRLITSDNTIASGRPGILLFSASGTASTRVTAWEGGNIEGYNQDRNSILNDTWDSSISGSWTNGPQSFATLTWQSPGYVRPSSASTDCAVVYGSAIDDDQWAQIQIPSAITPASNYWYSIVRQQTGGDGAYQGLWTGDGTDRYEISEISSSFTFSTLTSVANTSWGGANDTLTLEIKGTSLRLGSNEGAGDAVRIATTDNTWTSGRPGHGASGTVSNLDVTRTEIGDFNPSVIGTISFSTDANNTFDNKLTAETSTSFNKNLNFINDNNKTTSNDLTLSTLLTQNQVNNINKLISILFDINVDKIQQNQLNITEAILYESVVSQIQQNQKISNNFISFNSSIIYDILNQLSSNLFISLNSSLDLNAIGSTAGIINESISFLASVSQVQENSITIEKAVNLTLNLASEYNIQLDKNEVLLLLTEVVDIYNNQKGISIPVSFNTILSEDRSNTLDKLGTLVLSIFADQTVETQLNYNLLISFAPSILANFNTEGQVDASIIFNSLVNQESTALKNTSEALSFNVQNNQETTFNLTIEGTVEFSLTASQNQNLQLLSQAGITFGHLLGLASINTADLSEDILLGVIQDLQSDSFVLQFNLITPRNRIMKVYIEDRISILNEENRIITVSKIETN